MKWNIAPEFCALVILTIVWLYEKKGSHIPSFKNKVFHGCLIITFLGIVSSIASTLMIEHYTQIPIWLTWLATTIYFLFTPVMGMIYFYYTAAVIYTKYREIKNILIIVGIPTMLYGIAILANVFTKNIFDLTLENGYVRGPWVWITYIIFYFYCLLSVALVAYKHKKVEEKTIQILLCFPILATVIIVIQQTHPNTILSGFAASCALLIVYLYLQNKQIYIDYLTKIPNRWELINMLDFISQNGRRHKKAVLIVLSLRDFKMVNDRFGQQVGDAFLQKISKFLCLISPKGSVYRFNGDEFAVLLQGDDAEDVKHYVRKVQDKMNRMWKIGQYSSYLSMAVGIVTSTEGRSVESMIQSAEYAVVEAKKGKDNYVCYCDDAMLSEIERKKVIADILRQKLQDKSFEMYYQPIYATPADKFLYVESLIRMNDTPIGPIYPSEFIPIAEETGIIIELTYEILDKVCKFVKNVLDNEIPIECVHVNFSPIQFSQINLEERVMNIIHENNIPSSKIKIEFTESAVAESTDSVVRFSKYMRSHGIKMGLDDFGTGYSNVSTVMNIPFHAIKLDKSLVWIAMKAKSGEIMVRNIINAFKGLGMQVVAEGVETKEQLDAVIDFGVDQIQGYYFSKPLPSDEALEFLREHNK